MAPLKDFETTVWTPSVVRRWTGGGSVGGTGGGSDGVLLAKADAI
ncbi:MAG TPA: hypothetical protein VHW05_13455 [Phenylobacterium sp.]|nr:hypothetical protein [Phenylobacterium sp.]